MMTTGERSLMNRIHGGFKALSEQSKDMKDEKEMKQFIKKVAMLENDYPSYGKPVRMLKGGKIKTIVVTWPESLSGQSTQNGMIVMQTIQEIADAHNLYLYEYDEKGGVYRSVGGRTRAQMDEYIKDLEKKGEYEEVRKLTEPCKKDIDKIFGGVF